MKAQSRRATPLKTLLTADEVMELTDSSDDDLPDFKDVFQQNSSQKSSSSQKTVKRLESMKLEDDGFEMFGDHSLSPGLSSCPSFRSVLG